MKNLYFFLIITFILNYINIYGQDQEYQIGINPNTFRQSAGAYFDYSDPNGINIKVAVWGYVKFPGRYVIPSRTDIKDLISYAGGIDDNAFLDDIRIYRINADSSQSLLKFNYEDLWSGNDIKKDMNLVKIQAGDVLIIPGRPRLYWENYLNVVLSTLGFIISVATLVITATK